MRSKRIGLLFLVLGVGVIPSVASARRVESWPYEKLFKAADLVIVARPTGSEDCSDRSADNPWKEPFIGVNTTLKVNAVFKGKAPGETVKVLHFRVKDGVRIKDGPSHVIFRQDSLSLELKTAKIELSPPDYMLFLSARNDGRYEPVSGRVDPALSVRELYQPLPLDVGKRDGK